MSYQRVLLKLSGEALADRESRQGLDPECVASIARQIVHVARLGVEVAVVVGGGNILRGSKVAGKTAARASADYMGMLGTVINALALSDALEQLGQDTRVLTAIEIAKVAEPFVRRRALSHLAQGRVVILAGGTGNPFFTTDTAAALRATELSCEVLLKGTKVDGVYTADPKRDPRAQRYARISFDEAINKNLKVMDATALTLCRDQKLPINVFSIFKKDALQRVIVGEDEGTLVHV